MKVNGGNSSARVSLSIIVLVFAAIGSDHVHSVPLNDKPNNGSSAVTAEFPQPPAGNQSAPALIFPTDANVYKIVENDTALKILQEREALDETREPLSPVGKQDATGQNVPQQSSSGGAFDESTGSGSKNGTATDDPSATVSYGEKGDDTDDYSTENDDDDDDDDDTDDYSSEDAGIVDTDTEQLQPEGNGREDGLEEQFGNQKDNHYPMVLDDTMIEVSAMRKEHVWVIMVGLIFVLSLAAYIGMILYRNRLEQRYGMRQRLVMEDDYYTNNDI